MHRCVDCGKARVYWPGQRCDACGAVHDDRQRRERLRADAMLTVPPRYRALRFDGAELAARVKDPGAIERVRRALAEGVDRVLLLGPAGAGKTSIAAAALAAATYDRTADGLFIAAHDLAPARANAPLGREPELVATARTVGVLVLDELHGEAHVPTSPVAEVVHARHAAMLTTIVTTGQPLEALAQRYGDGLVRRLVEDAEVIDLQTRRGA